MIILSDKELSDAIALAFEDTFKVLLGDLKVTPSSITSNNNVRLSLYKFYYNHKLHRGLFTESWLNDVFKISDEGQDSLTLNSFKKFVPYLPDGFQADLTKTHVKSIKSGLRVFFYALYARKAVLLPTNYAVPRSNSNKTWVEHAMGIYPELLALFRNCFINKSNEVPDISEFLPSEDNTFCRDYAYKIFIAIGWYNIEDICLDEAIEFSKALYSKKVANSAYSSPKYSLPLHHVLTAVYRYAPTRCNFNIENISFLLNTNRSVTVDNIDNILHYEKNEKALIWLGLQKQYLNYRAKHFSSTEKSDKKALGLLNKYLFVDLLQAGGEKLVPSCPKYFSRVYIDGGVKHGGKIPPLLESVEGTNKSATYYSNLKNIEIFFEWLEEQKGNEYTIGFVNPISVYDFPLTKASKGTNKKIFPSKSFVVIHSLVHALCEFFYYLINSGKYRKQITTKFSCYDTGRLGFIPIYYDHDGNIIPINYIPSRLLSNVVTKRNGKLYDYPSFQGLFLLAVALETGLRHIHIRWLDRDTFDKYLEPDVISGEVLAELYVESAFIEVPTDKVKKEPWQPYVSHRVIKLLMRLKNFQDSLDIKVPALFYDNNKNTHYKKIRSLFHLASIDASEPFSYERTVTLYRNIQLFFDLHVSMKKINRKALNSFPKEINTIVNSYKSGINELTEHSENNQDVDTLEKTLIQDAFSFARKYKSDYTPHGTRSSVISERIMVLPPWAVAEFVSGHESLAVLHHYVQLDAEKMLEILKYQTQMLMQNGSVPPNAQNGANCELVNEQLRQVIDTDPSLIKKVFGGTSFSELADGKRNEIKSGINLIGNTPTSNMAFMSTHICPFNGQCPQDVIKDIGKNKCGACYYSIKTVDHIPRILAEVRKLNNDVKNYQKQISQLYNEEDVDEASIDKLDREKNETAFELAAWIHTYEILNTKHNEQLRKNESSDCNGAYVIAKPFITHKKFMQIKGKNPETVDFLLRMQDADSFKEYYTPSLKNEILHIRNKILINQKKYDQLIVNTDSFSIIDELRGLIRDIAEKEKKSPLSVIEHLKEPLCDQKLTPQLLLEALHG